MNAAGPMRPPSHSRLRGRLFRKYLLLIIALVSVATLTSGGVAQYFWQQETQAALADLQREKAIGAASRIEQYITQVARQIGFAALPQIGAADVELRRIEFLKLLRQVPEVTDIALLDSKGREQTRGLAPGYGRRGLGTRTDPRSRPSSRRGPASPGMARSISARRPSPT